MKATSTHLSSLARSSACSLDSGIPVLAVPARSTVSGWVLAAAALLTLLPRPAIAQGTDLLLIPFIGAKFAGHTTIVDPANPEHPAGQTKTTFGVSSAILTEGLFGVEADLEHVPHFFESGVGGGLVAQSDVTTLTGNVLIAVPRSITRESLRPFAVAGLGLMHAHIQTIGNVFDTNINLLGLDLGGGVIGFISPRAGVRFELLHFKNLSNGGDAVAIGTTG